MRVTGIRRQHQTTTVLPLSLTLDRDLTRQEVRARDGWISVLRLSTAAGSFAFLVFGVSVACMGCSQPTHTHVNGQLDMDMQQLHVPALSAWLHLHVEGDHRLSQLDY